MRIEESPVPALKSRRECLESDGIQVDLLRLGGATAKTDWPLGRVVCSTADPTALVEAFEHHLTNSTADFCLIWDDSLGQPDPETVLQVAKSRGDGWHAGLRLGLSGLPHLLDHAAPGWTLNCDPEPTREASSWRVSLRACLIRTDVLVQVLPRTDFESLDACGLEWGRRLVACGALLRHVPELLPSRSHASPPSLSSDDELRFVLLARGTKWTKWAVARACLSRPSQAGRFFGAWLRVRNTKANAPHAALVRDESQVVEIDRGARVSVLVPTVDRYPYLRTLLAQLREQTIPPCEIIVVDQTRRERRDDRLAADFDDLPLRMIVQDEPGQCTSRNAGLCVAKGDYILFIDDDDEVPSDLIEQHLRNLERFGADASCGGIDEVGAEHMSEPASARYPRLSGVFPTCNTLLRTEALRESGLFDLAYDRGQRADGDLGLRLYQTGALLVLDTRIRVLHHHAPSGGLRLHKARVITYASSRVNLTQRRLPSVTEMYLARRYCTETQQRELLWLAVLGTFSLQGNAFRKAAKVLISAVCLPHTLWTLCRRRALSKSMMADYPQIPPLPGPRDGPKNTDNGDAKSQTQQHPERRRHMLAKVHN